jgi:hypothetical protein
VRTSLAAENSREPVWVPKIQMGTERHVPDRGVDDPCRLGTGAPLHELVTAHGGQTDPVHPGIQLAGRSLVAGRVPDEIEHETRRPVHEDTDLDEMHDEHEMTSMKSRTPVYKR